MIVKPEGGSQGDGIFLVQNASDLRLKLDAKPHFGAGFGALAQRYLPDPLLLDGLKFDLRLYVVLLSVEPLEAYLCKEGLARFCTQSYEAPSSSNMNEAYMHLTNYSVARPSRIDSPFRLHLSPLAAQVNKKSLAFKDEDPFNAPGLTALTSAGAAGAHARLQAAPVHLDAADASGLGGRRPALRGGAAGRARPPLRRTRCCAPSNTCAPCCCRRWRR